MTWQAWYNWGFAVMLVGIFMTVFGFVIGSMHHVRLCRHLGKLFHLLLVLYVLASLIWFVWGPFIFWDSAGICCNDNAYGENTDVSHHFFNVFYGVALGVIGLGLLVGICLAIRSRRNQFRY